MRARVDGKPAFVIGEPGVGPPVLVVTSGACRREPGSRVRAVVIRLVAGHAVVWASRLEWRREPGHDVARRTAKHGVNTDEFEAARRCPMVEQSGARPRHRLVTVVAVFGEPGGTVVDRSRRFEVGPVTVDARGFERGVGSTTIVSMACLTRDLYVSPGQGKRRSEMDRDAVDPVEALGIVAVGTGPAELSLVDVGVTVRAGCVVRPIEASPLMARDTTHAGMALRERKPGGPPVIEIGEFPHVGPGRGSMAVRAIEAGREPAVRACRRLAGLQAVGCEAHEEQEEGDASHDR